MADHSPCRNSAGSRAMPASPARPSTARARCSMPRTCRAHSAHHGRGASRSMPAACRAPPPLGVPARPCQHQAGRAGEALHRDGRGARCRRRAVPLRRDRCRWGARPRGPRRAVPLLRDRRKWRARPRGPRCRDGGVRGRIKVQSVEAPAPRSSPASPASAPPRSARRSMPATCPSTRRAAAPEPMLVVIEAGWVPGLPRRFPAILFRPNRM